MEADSTAAAPRRKARKREKNGKGMGVSKRGVRRRTKLEKVHAPEQTLRKGRNCMGS